MTASNRARKPLLKMIYTEKDVACLYFEVTLYVFLLKKPVEKNESGWLVHPANKHL